MVQMVIFDDLGPSMWFQVDNFCCCSWLYKRSFTAASSGVTCI